MTRQTPNASRETSVEPLTIKVLLSGASGALRVGDYTPGEHTVRADDAIRLVETKGFTYATPADAQLAAGHIEQRNATVIAQAEVAAVADGEGGGTTSQTQE
jgi:hypothetical protein